MLVRLAEVRHDLARAARVTADHAHAVREDLEHVVAGLLASTDTYGGRGARVHDEEVLEAPHVGHVLVAAQDQVDAVLSEHAQQVTRVGDDVALPAGTGDGDEMVVERDDLELGGLLEPLLDPVIAVAPDAPAVEVRFGGVDPEKVHPAESDLRLAGAEQRLEVDLADVARIVVPRHDQHAIALDPVEQRACLSVFVAQAHVGQVT